MKSDKNVMRCKLAVFLFLSLTGNLSAQTSQILTLEGPGQVSFSVDASERYVITIQGSTPPWPEVGIWETIGTGRVLAGRNRDYSGYLSDRMEVDLKAGQIYTLQQTGSTGKTVLNLSRLSWSTLRTDLQTELRPENRDLGELIWVASLPLTEKPRLFLLSGSQAGLVGVTDSRGLNLYKRENAGFSPLGEPRSTTPWDSWALGETATMPFLAYSFPSSASIKSEARMEIWNTPDWQLAPPFPAGSGGPLQIAAWKGKTYVAHWQIRTAPSFHLLEAGTSRVFPGPVLDGPVSSQFRLETKSEGIWGFFHIAQGTDRWYQLYLFDGRIWSSLDFPQVKNPRLLLTAQGPEPLAGVVDPQGTLLLYRREKDFWSALSAPPDWKFEPRNTYYLTSTTAGITLFIQDSRGFSYLRWREGQWNQPQRVSGAQLLDVSANSEGEGFTALLRSPPSLRAEIFRIP